MEGFVPQFNSEFILNNAGNEAESGRLVFYENLNKLFFEDSSGRQFSKERVLLLKRFYNDEDGQKALPKPYVRNGNEIKETGDEVLYTRYGADLIIILGSLQSLAFSHNDPNMNYEGLDKLREDGYCRNNTDRYFMFHEDGKGAIRVYLEGKQGTGNVELKVKGSEGNGNCVFGANGIIAINQSDKDDKVIAQIYFDNTEGSERIKIIDKYKNVIELNQNGVRIKAETIDITGKDSTDSINLKTILTDLIDAIIAMTQPTNTGSTLAPPVNLNDFIKVKDNALKLLKENS